MEKKRIFVAMWSQRAAGEFMDEVFHSLIERKLYCKRNWNTYVLETHNTITRFLNMDRFCHPIYTEGIRADALFGREPYKSYLRDRLAPGAPYDVGMGLVDYICKVEEDAAKEQMKKVYITSASPHRINNTYWDVLMKYCNTVDSGLRINYRNDGNIEFVKKIEEDAYIQNDNFMTKELWTKMNPYNKPNYVIPEIKTVYFNNPVTVVLWTDGTKTIVRCQEGDTYDPEKGLAMAVAKKLYGNKGRYYDIFRKWIPGDKED